MKKNACSLYLLQGHDTTAMASNWATHLIGTDPEVQKKVHEELDSIFGMNHLDASVFLFTTLT